MSEVQTKSKNSHIEENKPGQGKHNHETILVPQGKQAQKEGKIFTPPTNDVKLSQWRIQSFEVS